MGQQWACIGSELRKKDGQSWAGMEEERTEELGANKESITRKKKYIYIYIYFFFNGRFNKIIFFLF